MSKVTKKELITRISNRFDNDKSWTSKKRLTIDNMDTLWGIIIREVGYCEKCGNGNALEAHHLVERGVYRHRYDLYNGICLCKSCHKYSNDASAHGRMGGVMSAGYRFTRWMAENRPAQWAWYEANMNNRDNGTLYKDFYFDEFNKLVETETPVW